MQPLNPHQPVPDSSSVSRFPGGVGLGFITGEGPAPRRRLFIGLVAGTAVLLCLLLLAGWVVPYVGFGNIHSSVPVVTGILLALGITAIACGAMGLVYQTLTGKFPFGSAILPGLTIRFFLPVMEITGRLVGFDKREIRRSFIKVNNQMSLVRQGSCAPEKILLLLPHCIQRTDCATRLTYNVDACKRCGKCPIADLLAIRDAYGIALVVATGGSIARLAVAKTRPSLIIAVACERDLASGIQDVYPLPTFGILNSRPEGPCRNTLVAPALVEEAVRYFVFPSLAGDVSQIYPGSSDANR